MNSIFHLLEAGVLLVIAYDYYHHGKVALPACYLLASIGNLIVAGRKARHGSLAGITH